MAGGAETKGQKLARLRERAGMSLGEIAKAGGYKGRSSVQRFFGPDYDAEFLPIDVAQRLARALVGKGSPPVTLQELFTLAGVPLGGVAETFTDQALGNIGALPRDVPVYGTALGAEGTFDTAEESGSVKVEQAELDQSEVLGYLRRPPALEGRKDVYGVYIAGASMFPRFSEGEAVFVDPKRPPMIGDDVIVYLVGPDEHEGERITTVLVKRLRRRTAQYVELEQFNPACSFRLETAKVRTMHRIIPAGELLS